MFHRALLATSPLRGGPRGRLRRGGRRLFRAVDARRRPSAAHAHAGRRRIHPVRVGRVHPRQDHARRQVLALCDEHPSLQERYDLRANKGYLSHRHMQGLKVRGLSRWHRQSFRIRALDPA